MRVAVTGAGGFVGRSLCALLESRGDEVIRVARKPSLEDLAGCQAIVHLAALAHQMGRATPDYDAYHVANALGARDVALTAQASGVQHMVLVSTIGVHGDRSFDQPLDEQSAFAPYDNYSHSKLAGERLVSGALLGSSTGLTIVRPPMVIGAGAPGNWQRLVNWVSRGVPLPFALLRNSRSYLGIDNLCAFLVVCIERPEARGQAFVISDDPPLATAELVGAIAKAQGRSARLWRCPPSLVALLLNVAGRRRDWRRLNGSLVVDSSHARALLNWQAGVSLQEAIARAAASSAALVPGP
jgi:nucleoside-diphosphate-sugar epimerase